MDKYDFLTSELKMEENVQIEVPAPYIAHFLFYFDIVEALIENHQKSVEFAISKSKDDKDKIKLFTPELLKIMETKKIHEILCKYFLDICRSSDNADKTTN